MRRASISSILAFAFFLGPLAAIPAGSGYAPPVFKLPRLAATEESLGAGLLEEPLSADDFLRISVHLSLVDPAAGASDAAPSLEALRAFLAREAPRLLAIEDEYARADAALKILHEELLSRYAERSTGTDALVLSGSYNCVSSAVVYAALAKASGLRIVGVEAPDHAFCSVYVNGTRIDVETTNPHGFDPGKKKDIFSDSFGRITGYAYVPQENYRMRRDLSEKELLSLIIRNRMSDLEAAGRPLDALSLASELYAFLPTDKSRELLGERVSNSAASYANSGRYEEALVILDAAALAFDAPHRSARALPKTGAALDASLNNVLSSYGASARYDEGMSFIEFARARYGDDPAFSSFERMRANNSALALLKSGDYPGAISFIDGERAAGRFPAAEASKLKENAALSWVMSIRGDDAFMKGLALAGKLSSEGSLGARAYADLLSNLCGREANAIAASDPELGWLKAAGAFEAGLELLPSSQPLITGRKKCLENYEATVLNRSATLLNARKAAEAVKILEEALRLYPEGSRMKERLAAARKAAR